MTGRPTATKDIIQQAAEEIAREIDGDATAIVECYREGMDGYVLAKELDDRYGWDLLLADAEALDDMTSIVYSLVHKAEKQWAEDNDIQPSLNVGDRITEGIITGVCPYSAARYLVKENGYIGDDRHLLIKFENAKLIEE